MLFTELARGYVGGNRQLVVSRRSDGKYSIAQLVKVDMDGKETELFIKNAIVTDEQGLRSVRNVIDEAIRQIGKN